MPMQNTTSTFPHVLIFPLPLQGAINSMLKLAELLSISNINITFLVTDHIHSRLLRHTNIISRFKKYPGFVLHSISDGLPEEHPRSGARYMEMFDSMKFYSKSLLTELLTCGQLENGGRGPGMENFLRGRDLPSFCRSDTLSDPSIQLFKNENQENARAQGLILNTFDDLEGPVLDILRTSCPNIYTIGPLHTHLKMKLAGTSGYTTTSSNSLRKEDKSCMSWLDSQPYKSVIYVSFGSIATVTRDQLMEFWYGLVNSRCKFLWVIRPDSISGDGEIPTEVLEGTKERGYIVGWAPQEEVLGHRSVGGFLTHSGWNSTLESVVEGMPMICWPYFMDQQVNSRFVSEVWKLGLDMKDACDRVIVEKMLKELMIERKDEFIKSANRMAMLAKRSLSEGGSSCSNLERLVKDIKTTTSVVHKEQQ